MNDLVVNMADDRWPIGSCISAHFSNFLPYQERFHCITISSISILAREILDSAFSGQIFFNLLLRRQH